MSALEPDAPAAHIWPHWREAVRSWAAHRRGAGASRPSLGAVRGKGPTAGDIVMVGRLLVQLGHIGTSGSLTPSGQQLLAVALGAMPRGEDRKVKTIVERVERRLRSAGLVQPPAPRTRMRRWAFTLQDGKPASHAYLDDSPCTDA